MKRMYAERSALWNTQNISQGSKLPIHHRLICKPSLPPSILPLYLLWCLTLHLIHSLYQQGPFVYWLSPSCTTQESFETWMFLMFLQKIIDALCT